jgi:hypothetical protein
MRASACRPFLSVVGGTALLACAAITGAGDLTVGDRVAEDASTTRDASGPSDPCASCEAPPNARVTCVSGVCGYTCNAGRADCNQEAADGCEIELAVDPENCGRCGRECPGANTCNDGGCLPTCADLVTDASVWDAVSTGVALGPFTNGTLDWIGCVDGNGCATSSFFCSDEATGIYFGAEAGTLRAVVDPGNGGGAAFPASKIGCCTAANPRDVCNAPVAANNGVGGINAGDALCKAMGFASGAVVAEVASNVCPKPHATTPNGSNWTSDFAADAGYGREYRCTR